MNLKWYVNKSKNDMMIWCDLTFPADKYEWRIEIKLRESLSNNTSKLHKSLIKIAGGVGNVGILWRSWINFCEYEDDEDWKLEEEEEEFGVTVTLIKFPEESIVSS